MGVPPVIIHGNMFFHEINHPANGVPPGSSPTKMIQLKGKLGNISNWANYHRIFGAWPPSMGI